MLNGGVIDMRAIDVAVGDVKIAFRVKDGITLVGGDSGTGKTLLFHTLQKHKLLGEYQDVVLINYLDEKNKPISDYLRFLGLEGKMIVIDNADILLSPEDRRYILVDQSRNTYLLFGRRPDYLNLSAMNIAQVVRTGDTCVLEYLR